MRCCSQTLRRSVWRPRGVRCSLKGRSERPACVRVGVCCRTRAFDRAPDRLSLASAWRSGGTTKRTLGPAAHTPLAVLGAWAASDRGTSYSEQAPSGSVRHMELRFPREGGDLASLELIACSEDGHLVIKVRVTNVDPFADGTAHPRYPTWQAAIDSGRRQLAGPISHSRLGPEAAAIRTSGTFARRWVAASC